MQKVVTENTMRSWYYNSYVKVKTLSPPVKQAMKSRLKIQLLYFKSLVLLQRF